jgi:hypothetical protein
MTKYANIFTLQQQVLEGDPADNNTVRSNHFQDYASTDAYKQGEEQQLRDISKDACYLPNFQPQRSDIVRSKPWSHSPMNVAPNEDATCLLPPEDSAWEPSQDTIVRYKHIASLADAPSWHDTIPFISTLSLIVTIWLYWWLPTSFTTCIHYQWNASSPRIHQQNRVTKSTAPFATPPMSRALAAWCILVLGCCGNSPLLQSVHTHALSIGQVPLFKKFSTQQTHTTLYDAGNPAQRLDAMALH